MREAISLFVTFIVIAIVYEYMKPKNDYSATNQHKEPTDNEKND